jgi:protein-disulfide isomerase
MTRRAFLEGTALLTVAAAFAGSPLWSATQVLAQAPSAAELNEPGPLGDQVQGKADAPVTIIEYASMTCSHCATFHVQTYPQLKQKYIETGKVKYILREFPLDELAAGAFMVARCAGDGKYYDAIEAMFKGQQSWAFVRNPIPPLFAIAKNFGLNEQTFEKCLSDQKMLDGVNAVRQRGQEKFGVNSTPTFFINGKIFRGAMTFPELEQQIAAAGKS